MSTIVIGGGLAGASVALALARRGLPVLVVEPTGTPGAATPASAGMLAPLYEAQPDDPLLAVGLKACAAYPAFLRGVEELSGISLPRTTNGMLIQNATQEEHDGAERAAIAFGLFDAAARVIEPEAARRIAPAAGSAISYLWLPAHGHLDARALAEAMPAALGAAGAEVLSATAASILTRGAAVEGILLHDGRQLEGAAVVIAAGAWSSGLAGLPRPLPVRPVRGEMLLLGGPVPKLGCPLADHTGHYLVPAGKRGLLAGSTMEEAGFDASVSRRGREMIRRTAARLAPQVASSREVDAWAGLRPVTADGLPLLGHDPELAGLWYATGYGRSGILLAPYLGELLAAVMEGEAIDPEARTCLHAARPGRFAGSSHGTA